MMVTMTMLKKKEDRADSDDCDDDDDADDVGVDQDIGPHDECCLRVHDSLETMMTAKG